MPDIAGKLFPNLTTLIVQLLSTGVTYFEEVFMEKCHGIFC